MAAMIVLSTFPDEETARNAANILIDKKIAACVSIMPGLTSIYRWQGQIENSREVLMMAKTTPDNYDRLESALKACHPYELPEILAVATECGLPDYLQWVAQETAPDNENSNERLP
jgi:periplasmic divalent cation tolerance protein